MPLDAAAATEALRLDTVTFIRSDDPPRFKLGSSSSLVREHVDRDELQQALQVLLDQRQERQGRQEGDVNGSGRDVWLLHDTALVQMLMGRWDEAVLTSSESMKGVKAKDSGREGETTAVVGHLTALACTGRTEEAFKLARERHELAVKRKDLEACARLLDFVKSTHDSLGQNAEGLLESHKIIETLKDSGVKEPFAVEVLALALLDVGDEHQGTKRYDDATSAYRLAFQSYESLGPSKMRESGCAMTRTADGLMMARKTGEALVAAEQALTLIKEALRLSDSDESLKKEIWEPEADKKNPTAGLRALSSRAERFANNLAMASLRVAMVQNDLRAFDLAKQAADEALGYFIRLKIPPMSGMCAALVAQSNAKLAREGKSTTNALTPRFDEYVWLKKTMPEWLGLPPNAPP